MDEQQRNVEDETPSPSPTLSAGERAQTEAGTDYANLDRFSGSDQQAYFHEGRRIRSPYSREPLSKPHAIEWFTRLGADSVMFAIGVSIGAISFSQPQVYAINAVSCVLGLIVVYQFRKRQVSQIWQGVTFWCMGIVVGTRSLDIWKADLPFGSVDGPVTRVVIAYLLCLVGVLLSIPADDRQRRSGRVRHDVYEAVRNSVCRILLLPVPITVAVLLLSLAGVELPGDYWMLTLLLVEVCIGLRCSADRKVGLAAVWTPVVVVLVSFRLPMDGPRMGMVELALLIVALVLATIWALRLPAGDSGTAGAVDKL